VRLRGYGVKGSREWKIGNVGNPDIAIGLEARRSQDEERRKGMQGSLVASRSASGFQVCNGFGEGD